MVTKLGFILAVLMPLMLFGQVNEKHVQKISRYMGIFTSYSDSLIVSLKDSMDVDDWRDIEVLTRLSDITHEAYLHAHYISGMLDMLVKLEDKDDRATTIHRTAFHVKGAIMFMKIANKMLVTELKLTNNPSIITMGMNLRKDTEKFSTELETVKRDLEFDYSYHAESYNR